MNPAALDRLRAALPHLAVVGEGLPVPLPLRYDPPSGLGLDRVMGVVGALARRPAAAGVLLLDAGTCLTATVGTREDGVLGGAIAPGPELMARSLAEGTAGLPRVDPGEPAVTIGRSTEGSIRAGVWAAWIGAARELVRSLRSQSPVALDVVAAGRGAGALGAALEEVDLVHPFAVLWGVYLTAEAAMP